MDCREVREGILDSLVGAPVSERRLAMEDHIAGCETCSRFAEIHRTLDARLAAAAPELRLSPGFRTSLRERMLRDPGSAWPEFLPDLAHLAGCAFAIVFLLFLLPRYAGMVFSAGVAFTAVTYFLQTVLLSSLAGLAGDT